MIVLNGVYISRKDLMKSKNLISMLFVYAFTGIIAMERPSMVSQQLPEDYYSIKA